MEKDTLMLLSKSRSSFSKLFTSSFCLPLPYIFFLSLSPLPPVLFSSPPSMDSSLLSNIQKLFYEKIEVFSKVEFSKLSITTGIVKIFLKVSCDFFL